MRPAITCGMATSMQTAFELFVSSNKEQILKTILSSLQSMPIFRLSLGSKELFHSNFLEFLWDMDSSRQMFIQIVNGLLPSGKQFSTATDYSGYTLSREKGNYDLCVFHKDKDKHLVYDLIIENKVKSIPFIGQLDKYVVNVQKNKWNSACPPRYLLLSLVDSFADKSDIVTQGIWEIANYDMLKTAIMPEQSVWSKAVGADYVKDYCEFIGLMHQLQGKILENFDKSELFKDVDEFKACRLHDLYIKLRCCEFLMLLKDRLVQRGLRAEDISFIKEHKDIRDKNVPHIYLNYNIFRGTGQAAAWLYTDRNNAHKDGDIHEIVIQGNQYRHGVNSRKHKLNGDDNIKSQEHIWGELTKDAFDANFLNLAEPRKGGKGRNIPLVGYGPDYIYRYDKIGNETVAQLLDRMADDVVATYRHYIPKP